MQRISHDLAGAAQRITKAGNAYQVHLDETAEVWKDDRGRAFLREHTSEILPTLNQLTSELSQTLELFEGLAKNLLDPDRN